MEPRTGSRMRDLRSPIVSDNQPAGTDSFSHRAATRMAREWLCIPNKKEIG